MMEFGDLQSEFNQAAEVLPKTDFADRLKGRFGRETARNVLEAFKKMGIPVPEGEEEYLDGTTGPLLFLNRYGVVIRIEVSDGACWDRVNDSAWILQPIASINTGEAIVEICPGCRFEDKESNSDYLVKQLRRQLINFCDDGARNTGRLPISTVKFPEGVPVVVDRLAVTALTGSVSLIRRALQKMNSTAQQAQAAQEELYAPLRKAFDEAYPDAGKMAQFWKLCKSYVQEGKLVAGWNSETEKYGPRDSKASWAAAVAESYEQRLSNATRSPVAAIPQSPSPQGKK